MGSLDDHFGKRNLSSLVRERAGRVGGEQNSWGEVDSLRGSGRKPQFSFGVVPDLLAHLGTGCPGWLTGVSSLVRILGSES